MVLVTKAEFATILCNMFHWNLTKPAAASFEDVAAASWYYGYVETALAHDVMDKSAAFQPNTPITRGEMAAMLVRALGLKEAAKLAQNLPLPFADVTANQGYIGVAYDIGMINGVAADQFAPANFAKREEAAAMLVRVYQKYTAKMSFVHGFYAISAYAQKELAAQMDAVTYSWSAMTVDQNKGVWLNTSSSANGNQYRIPQGYESITAYLEQQGVKTHLGVFMSQNTRELLLSPENRATAVAAIIGELTVDYQMIGKNPYSGVTIDFEGLRGSEVKAGFTAFLTALKQQLTPLGKSLYVAVQPKVATGSYFDGFDYQAIGNLADKVILMAHDYQPTSLAGYEGTTWQKNAPLTPISQVYYALKAAVDPVSGVADRNKLVLAVSFAAVGWPTDAAGKLSAATPVRTDSAGVAALLAAGNPGGFSQVYRNPYMTYTNASGQNIYLWYENAQSVGEKAALARLMGINGISLWRLGNIPNAPGYTVMNSF
ncbi:MAG: glycosyl hydrolase family 18 protein [Clostridiales bacterium]